MYAESSQILNSSRLCKFVSTAQTSLQHFVTHWDIIPVLKLTLCLGQFPVTAFRLIHILPSNYAFKMNILNVLYVFLHRKLFSSERNRLNINLLRSLSEVCSTFRLAKWSYHYNEQLQNSLTVS